VTLASVQTRVLALVRKRFGSEPFDVRDARGIKSLTAPLGHTVGVPDTAIFALITGGFTLASGLGGVAISHRFARKQFEASLRAQRHSEVRALVAECVEAGFRYVQGQEPFVLSLIGARGSMKFIEDWVDTDSGRQQLADIRAVARTTGELRLLVNDERLLTALATVTELRAQGGAIATLLDEVARDGTWQTHTLEAVFEHLAALRAAFAAVEARAAELLRGDL
jgi:hypothetical protein